MASRQSDFSKQLEEWLNFCREKTLLQDEKLLTVFDVYSAECIYGYERIQKYLVALERSATILEVGAGTLLLSCFLKIIGFNVTGLDPTADGFSHFYRIRRIILQCAEEKNVTPEILNRKAEHINQKEEFDFIFSINVMEHVDNIEDTLKKSIEALKSRGSYYFICPNYFFPYEPHFNIPIIISKELTACIFRKRIENLPFVDDSMGLWSSLNWINIFKLKKNLKSIENNKVFFSKNATIHMFDRLVADEEFQKRHPGLVFQLLKMLVYCRMHYAINFIPSFFLPVIECRIIKCGD